MKFFALAALVAAVSGIKIHQHQPTAMEALMTQVQVSQQARHIAYAMLQLRWECPTKAQMEAAAKAVEAALADDTVSYTHLTLPTSDLV